MTRLSVDATSADGGALPVLIYHIGSRGINVLHWLWDRVAAPPTSSEYDSPQPAESTTSGTVEVIDQHSPQTTAEAVLEIRRRSGLTWEKMSELFDVSRRSIHNWANGQNTSQQHERHIRSTLAVIRHLDQGNQAATRARLLTIDASRRSPIDLLSAGRFDEVMAYASGSSVLESHRSPMAPEAQDARRPPAPALLLEAEHERPELGGSKARIARVVRTDCQR